MGRVAFFLMALIVGVAAAGAEEQAKGWLGVELKDVTKEEADKLGWDGPRGAKIVSVVPRSPAESAGLKASDVLDTLDGVEIENKAKFEAAIEGKFPNTEIKLKIRREGKEPRIAVKLAAVPVVQAEAPLLQLDTGGHQAIIKGLAFTPDGKFIVSAGNDKVIRVWDWRAGKTVRTLRGQSGFGDEGKIYAMALSPNGRWLAVGGWFPGTREESDAIRLYDFATGELHALLKGHTAVIDGLAFDADGKKLISGSGLGDHSAIIWDVERRTILHRLKGHREDIYAVGFTPDGRRAVTGSEDNTLRLWRVADGALIKEMIGHADKASTLAISPLEGTIASGDNSGEIRLWNGNNGGPLKVFANQGGYVGSLRFSPDGRLLLSTCGYDGCNFTQRVYDAASGKELTAYTKHDNVVLAGAFSPDGRLVATAGGDNQEIHIWNPITGETKTVLKGTGRPDRAVGFGADGHSIAWGNQLDARSQNDLGPLETALRLPGPDEALGEPQPLKNTEGWLRAEASSGTLSLQHRKGSNSGFYAVLDLLKYGKPSGVSIERCTTDGYDHRSYGFTPDRRQIVSGGMNGFLTAYGLDGKKLGEFVGHEADVWAIAASPDGRYLVSGSSDQTVRLWNLKTRELLVTIFRGTDGEWAMWTPQGYYAASGPGSELVGWQINRGPDHAADYVTAAQLRKSLNRPDIVAKAIVLASAEEAVRTSPGTDFKLADLLKKPVPHFRIVSPAPKATLRGGSAELQIVLEATPDPVKLFRVQVNGREVDQHEPPKGSAGFTSGKHIFSVPLSGGLNTIRLTAINDIGETSEEVQVTHQGEGALDKRGVLYIVAIGIDKYPGLGKSCLELDGKTPKDCDLRVAGADAKAFAETMTARAGPLHQSVVSRVLVNGAKPEDVPTAANIRDALGVLRSSEPNDTVLLFISGHGFTEVQNYRILATDAAYQGGALRNSTVVPWVDFQEAVEAAKGRRILFLDTCHSGNSYNQRLSNDAYAANIIVYSASRWNQDALELYNLGHGVFTYAVVQGMNGAAKNAAGEVKTEGLRNFLKTHVPELAKTLKGEQEPQYFRGRDAQDYLLAFAK